MNAITTTSHRSFHIQTLFFFLNKEQLATISFSLVFQSKPTSNKLDLPSEINHNSALYTTVVSGPSNLTCSYPVLEGCLTLALLKRFLFPCSLQSGSGLGNEEVVGPFVSGFDHFPGIMVHEPPEKSC